MSAHKIEFEERVILDLTNKILTYDKVYCKLNTIRVKNLYSVKNCIKIGKYTICFKLHESCKNKSSKVLLNYLLSNDKMNIDLKEDFNICKNINYSIIKDEPWFHSYLRSTFSVKELTSVVMFLNRLESLNSFS
jgi:hypothetical protein